MRTVYCSICGGVILRDAAIVYGDTDVMHAFCVSANDEVDIDFTDDEAIEVESGFSVGGSNVLDEQ